MGYRTSLLAAGLALSSLATPSLAGGESGEARSRTGFYGTFGAGYATFEEVKYLKTPYDTDPGVSLETGFGYKINDHLRGEITYGLNVVGVEDKAAFDDIDTNSLIFSAYYDINNDSKWTPYVGAGYGTTTLNTDAPTDDSDTAETWQVKVGITYAATDKFDVFGEFAHQNIEATRINNNDNDPIRAYRGQLGVRYWF